MEFDLVIKVKYADTLRRFNVHVKERDMDLDIPRLREKILNSFKLSPDANLTLTYVDEDNDVVTLVDDDDLRDAALIQRLNPLRINVSENSGYVPSDTRSLSGKSTPVRSPQVQTQLSSIGMGVEEALKAVSGPLHDALFKLTDDLASKVTSPASLLNELVGSVSKLELAPVSPVSQAQGGSTHASIPTPVSHGIVDLNAPVAQEPSVDSATKPKVVPNTTDAVNQISVKCSKDNAKTSRGVASSSIACNDLSLDIVKDGVPFVWPFEENVELQKAWSGVETKATVNDLVNLTPYPSHTSSELLTQQGEKNKQPLDGVGPSAPPVGFSPQGNEVNSEIGGSNYWAVPPRKLTRFGHHQFKRSFGHRDSMFRTFHRGVQCDACGMSPIVGPRFKSKLRENFDLCNICFSEMGNEAEFSRIDNGMYRPPGFLKNINKPHLLRFQVPPVHIHGPGLRSCKPKLESRFIQDVTVLDETSMAPSTPFTKIWRMRNSGTVAWPPATMIVWIGGDRMGNGSSVELEIPANGCPVNEELDIAVEFTAPSKPGRYISYWKMATPWGQKFGQRVWVLIQVDADQKDTSPDTLHLNLNLPPVNSSSEQKKNGVIDVNIEPFENEPFENVPAVTGHSNMTLEQVKPLGLQHPNDQIDFQNVGNKASASASYPIIDLSELLTVSPAEVTPQPSKPTNPVEESLLKELEEMGFKQFDLNQEVLRRNNYNMENSLDDLCDMAEWDPILEDLQEMGFCDREMNKKLLIKNGGSIKRVVLDLIAGEKE